MFVGVGLPLSTEDFKAFLFLFYRRFYFKFLNYLYHTFRSQLCSFSCVAVQDAGVELEKLLRFDRPLSHPTRNS
jgi:hypothetical protein